MSYPVREDVLRGAPHALLHVRDLEGLLVQEVHGGDLVHRDGVLLAPIDTKQSEQERQERQERRDRQERSKRKKKQEKGEA
jgi:hypothetical protein